MKELNTFRQFLTEGKKEIKEGTWSLGSLKEMTSALQALENIRKMGRMKGAVEINKLDSMFYNVFGDDSFHDALDAAKMATDDDTFNNMLGDAQARALNLYNDEYEEMRASGELEENDSVLDEIIGEEKEEVNESMQMFREIDDMLSRAAIHMDGEDFANELIQEFEAIPGAAPILHKALKNLMANNGIPEADPEEDQKIINKRNNV